MDEKSFQQFLIGAKKAGASDIHIGAGSAPSIRVNGELRPVRMNEFTPSDTEGIASFVLKHARWAGELDDLQDYDCSYSAPGIGRFRVSVFRQRNTVALVLRAIAMEVPNFEALGLPPVLQKIAQEERGLVLITGVTGSGKTSTLAAMVNYINHTSTKHILSIEDPIEYMHKDARSRVTQREIGPDTRSFASALRSALRQDPDVILVGEMRDPETIEIALKAAETGHLVLSTAHTVDAVRTIGRVVGAFPSDAQQNVRNRLAEALKATVSQRLLRRADGRGRVVALEIMINRTGIDDLIRSPERTGEMTDYMVKGRDMYGTQSFDQHLAELMKQGFITMDVAKEAASNPADFERALTFS